MFRFLYTRTVSIEPDKCNNYSAIGSKTRMNIKTFRALLHFNGVLIQHIPASCFKRKNYVHLHVRRNR